ncbi:MAG: Rrf2 family transcriptional regulator [Planctomycetales bacterium]|nr:Rrf2 family transcriptional regulator [Planctomycetales bacterium]
MISQTVEYALRAVVTLAQHEGSACTAQQLAEWTQVPSAYLSKLMQGLVRAELVSSRRGLNGGFVLARSPDSITLWDVVDALEPFQRITRCPLNLHGHGVNLCPLHRLLDDAMAAAELQLRETRVSDVVAEKGRVTPLCDPSRQVVACTLPLDASRSVDAAEAKARRTVRPR